MKIELNKTNIATLFFSVALIGIMCFSGGKYVTDGKVREYQDSTLVWKRDLVNLKDKNNDLQKADRTYRDSLRAIREKINIMEQEARENLERLENEPSELADTLDVGEQQEYFDNRYPYDEIHVVALDSLQGRDIVEHLEERDRALVSLHELQKLHITYKTYALNAGMIISNQTEIISNLETQLSKQLDIINNQAEENKKLKRLVRRQKFKTKFVSGGGILLIAAAVIFI